MADINRSITKLIGALNQKGYMLMYNKKQFMGVEGKPHNLYTVTQAVWNADKHKYGSVEVYKSTSTVRIVLFLRDAWFQANGWDLPTDNQMWNKIREDEKWAQLEQVVE